jgi:hypothetical protein
MNILPHSPFRFFSTASRAALVAALALALSLAPGAATAPTPLLNLGPIVVANGLATVSGTLSSGSTATSVTVNGQTLGVDAAGAFVGTVPLNGASSISLTLGAAGTDGSTTFRIPVTGSGVIPGGALDALQQAGASLLTPIVGTDGQPLTVSGSVADGGQLAGLSVNGKDVLSTVGPGGGFTVQLPGTTKVVTLTATDTHGNSQTTAASVSQQPATAKAATTVSAANAVGVKIAGIKFVKKAIKGRYHQLKVIVTVKDRLNRLVRGAKVTIRSTKARKVVRQPRLSRSGPKGRVTIKFRVRAAALGKGLVLVTTAKTPKAKATKKNNVLLPKAKKAKKKRRKH